MPVQFHGGGVHGGDREAGTGATRAAHGRLGVGAIDVQPLRGAREDDVNAVQLVPTVPATGPGHWATSTHRPALAHHFAPGPNRWPAGPH